MADVLGFATRGTKKNPKAVAANVKGSQKELDAIRANAGVLGSAVGMGADKEYKKFQEEKKKKRSLIDRQQVQVQQEKQVVTPKKPSLLTAASRGIKEAGKSLVASEQAAATGIARVLPGGTADIDAQTKAADQVTKDLKMIKNKQRAGKLNPEAAKKLIKLQTNRSNEVNKENSKTIKDMPTAGQVAAGFAGTAADILTAGSYGAASRGIVSGAKAAKSVKAVSTAEKAKKGITVIKKAVPMITGTAAAGGFNAAAAGGDKGEITKNAILGAAFPDILAGTGTLTAKVLGDVASKIKAPKKLLEQTKAQSLLRTAEQKKVMAAKVETRKVDQQIELLRAKKADGKFTNVDKIKIKQLEAKKQELMPKSTRSLDNLQTQIVSGHGGDSVPTPTTSKVNAVAAATPTTVPASGVVKESSVSTIPNAPDSATIEIPPTKTKTNDQVPQATKPLTTATPEPVGTRTLKPSETAHMSEIGGYTHSTHMAQEYADMLRSQELGATGGQMIKNADGSYRRISEHSRFYRDFYKENGRVPTKADYLEQAKKELETGKDGMGAGEDYKKLLEREGKPVPRVEVASTIKDTSQGTSKVGDTALENAVGKSLKNKYGEAAQYDKITIKDQAKKAVALTEDKELLERVIAGDAPLPDGLRATALIDAIERHPVLGKDTDLLVKIAKSPLASESSYSAQELRLAAERVEHSPIEAMKKLRQVREKAAEKKLKTTVAKATSDEIKQIRTATPKIPKETFESFVESLKC